LRHSAIREATKREKIVMIPGMTQLLKDIKRMEDLVRDNQSREEFRTVIVTREEADVIDSFRRFKAQDYD
jgi:hypothetical protein